MDEKYIEILLAKDRAEQEAKFNLNHSSFIILMFIAVFLSSILFGIICLFASFILYQEYKPDLGNTLVSALISLFCFWQAYQFALRIKSLLMWRSNLRELLNGKEENPYE